MRLVIAGFIGSLVWSGKVGTAAGLEAQAWTAGLQFLGESFLLAGIAFLLGSILASPREGGGQVQHELGLVVKTLKMPATAKIFVALMMMGVMLAVAQDCFSPESAPRTPQPRAPSTQKHCYQPRAPSTQKHCYQPRAPSTQKRCYQPRVRSIEAAEVILPGWRSLELSD